MENGGEELEGRVTFWDESIIILRQIKKRENFPEKFDSIFPCQPSTHSPFYGCKSPQL
jgi:hypothetical protein